MNLKFRIEIRMNANQKWRVVEYHNNEKAAKEAAKEYEYLYETRITETEGR